jgi:hypothetical protein
MLPRKIEKLGKERCEGQTTDLYFVFCPPRRKLLMRRKFRRLFLVAVTKIGEVYARVL